MFPIVVVKRSMPTCFQCELAHQKRRSSVVFVYEPFYSSAGSSVLLNLRIRYRINVDFMHVSTSSVMPLISSAQKILAILNPVLSSLYERVSCCIQNQCCRYFQSIQAVTAVKRCAVCSRKTHVSRRCLTSKLLSLGREPKLEIFLHRPQKISRSMPQPSSSKSNA